MKIGIITLPLKRNFGGILQAYALQKYLQDQGHTAICIDRQFNEGSLTPVKLAVKKIFMPGRYKIHGDEIAIAEKPSYFINKYISPKTKKITSEAQLKHVTENEKFDVVITGSDQVWRLDYSGALDKNLFLDFVNGKQIKKVSYAASFGKGTWDQNQEKTKELKALIQQFDSISVREDAGITICKEIFDVKATQHVDPTMLLSKEVYIKLAKDENEPKKEGNILVYMLDRDQERDNAINLVATLFGGTPFVVNAKTRSKEAPLADRIYPTVTGWLQGFVDAEFVFVDSFHGCVFSILFNKPFLAFGNKERGLARFTSLLKLFGLEDRLVLSKGELTKERITAPIDWVSVNAKVEKYRGESKSYFDSFLKN